VASTGDVFCCSVEPGLGLAVPVAPSSVEPGLGLAVVESLGMEVFHKQRLTLFANRNKLRELFVEKTESVSRTVWPEAIGLAKRAGKIHTSQACDRFLEVIT